MIGTDSDKESENSVLSAQWWGGGGEIVKKIFFFHHTTCESTSNTLASSAANQGDNTVSVAQGGYRNCVITLVGGWWG